MTLEVIVYSLFFTEPEIGSEQKQLGNSGSLGLLLIFAFFMIIIMVRNCVYVDLYCAGCKVIYEELLMESFIVFYVVSEASVGSYLFGRYI